MNIWHVQHRLFTEHLDDVLYADEAELPDETILRLTAAARVLLAQHQVDKRGRCQHCYRQSVWWLKRRKTCTVHGAFSVAMNQPLGAVWRWVKDWGGLRA